MLQDFYFRQLRKVRVGGTGVPGDVRCSLLCSSNEFGLTFAGCSKGVKLEMFNERLPSTGHTCTSINMYVHTFAGVQVFKTSILYEIDKDDSIGATNVIGKAVGYHLMKLVNIA